MKAAIYTRVSTHHQNTDLQRNELIEACKRNGWVFVAEHTDKGISGSKGRDKRPGLNALMKGVMRKDYDVVCVWSLDRMGRSLIDLVNILADLDAKNVGFYSHKQALDTTTPSGRLMFSIVGAMAEYEREIIRERIIAGLDAARAKGKRLGRPSKAKQKTDEVIQLRQQGWGMTKIANALSLGGSTINRICIEHGV